MRALASFAVFGTFALGAVRLWLQVKHPHPQSTAARAVRAALTAVLVIALIVGVIVLATVLVGVVVEVGQNVT